MRVCLVSREYPPFFGGGVGTYAREVVHALAEAGCVVHVVTEAHDESEPRSMANGRVTIHRIPFHSRSWNWPAGLLRFSADAGRLVAELSARGEIDIVEFAECEAAGAALAALRAGNVRALKTSGADRADLASEIRGSHAAWPLSIPLVVQLHTPTEQLFKLRSLRQQDVDGALAAQILAERWALREADLVCAPSRFIADWAHRQYDLPASPTVVPYPMRFDEAVEGTGMDRIVLFAGRIEPRKGGESLLRAWTPVARRHAGWTLCLAGGDTMTGPGRTSYWSAVRDIIPEDVAPSVRYLGSLTPAELRQQRARCALCVIPSLWENFPNTCIEAMAAGRAVLVSENGGMREMVGDTDGGRISRAGDAESLASELGVMISEGVDGLAERGRAAQARIRNLCDPTRTTAQRLAMYRTAMADRREEARRPHRRRDEADARLALWRCARSVATGQLSSLEIPESLEVSASST